MKRRRLGIDGPDITVLGIGTWAMGGPYAWGWGPQNDDDSVAAIRAGIETGINWIDTAPAYGFGHSEEVVGRAIAPFSSADVYLFTKCGLDLSGLDRNGRFKRDLRPEVIRNQCEQSLLRLGRNHIDLYQFHWPDHTTGTAVEDSWATMLELVDHGKVRWIGVSNFDIALLQRCEAMGHVNSVQPRLNLIDQSARDELLPWCVSNGTGIIAYSPLASGLLSGKYDRAAIEGLPPDDWRRKSPDFTEPQISRNLEIVARLKKIALEAGVSVPAAAIASVLAIDGITGAIVGIRRPSQIHELLTAQEHISDSLLATLDSSITTLA